MRRGARAVLTALAAFALATPSPAPPPPGRGEAAIARLVVEPVPLNRQAPGQLELGPLRYLGGWSLSSDDRRFGAISALAADADGTLLALSDHATLYRFAPPGLGPATVAIHPLGDGPEGLTKKIHRDSEAMALADRSLWVVFENSNEVWRYAGPDFRAVAKAAPEAMKKWPLNRGAEALLRLAGGRFLLISEDEDERGVSDALLFLGDPADPSTRAQPLRIDPAPGQRVTDAALLPDGRLLLLTRGLSIWNSWTARLLVARLPDGAGEMIETQQVAAFDPPLTRDNMEGLAVTQEGGRTIVWLASDDNLLPLQRTLLLKFEWVEQAAARHTPQSP
ncbi:MAG TPA: esterase-like activity of phytase family protein [Allosphingosinicella sp.]|nr:esterase-like activity of phytase family protein [Allosphingosinicella sp.]